ncbi:hypothetical protein [Shewanella sp.]|uniref:hypothetical protein n=1 Tax=Shewanella sp. TaxID=50422 RepID=UPI003F3D7186
METKSVTLTMNARIDGKLRQVGEHVSVTAEVADELLAANAAEPEPVPELELEPEPAKPKKS